MKTHDLNILAVYSLQSKAGRDMFAGMLEAMSDRNDWHLTVRQPDADFPEAALRDAKGREYDGYIVTMPGMPETMSALARSTKPTVLVNITDRALSARTKNISFVWGDGADIGRCGAEHLLSRGTYASVGYVHERQYEFYSYEREIGFRETTKAAGHSSLAFPPDNDFSDYDHRLRAWLRDLPKPAAIMTVSDMRAADVINLCRAENIAVPQDIAVIGVDNDAAQHQKCGLPISSVQFSCRQLGEAAVRELEFLFSHPNRRGRPHEILIPAQGVTPRESTAHSLAVTRLVQTALDFIRANAQRKLTRQEVAEHLGYSLQLIELRFRQHLGKTIRETIESIRLEEVNRRLLQEDFSVQKTAQDLGFTSANHLTRVYRRHFGCTITAAHSRITKSPEGSRVTPDYHTRIPQ